MILPIEIRHIYRLSNRTYGMFERGEKKLEVAGYFTCKSMRSSGALDEDEDALIHES